MDNYYVQTTTPTTHTSHAAEGESNGLQPPFLHIDMKEPCPDSKKGRLIKLFQDCNRLGNAADASSETD